MDEAECRGAVAEAKRRNRAGEARRLATSFRSRAGGHSVEEIEQFLAECDLYERTVDVGSNQGPYRLFLTVSRTRTKFTRRKVCRIMHAAGSDDVLFFWIPFDCAALPKRSNRHLAGDG
jgi:hypothetical protein